MPYQERWRERPDETRQPAYNGRKVPNPAAKRKMRILNVISALRIGRSAFFVEISSEHPSPGAALRV